MNEVNDSLLTAAEKGDLEATKAALESGAEIDTQNNFMKDSALHIASSKGHLDIVEYLVDNNADCLLVNGTDMTPLHLAARDGQTHVVKFLLAKIEDIPERVLNDIIHVASVSVYGRPEIVQMLEDYRVAQVRPDTNAAMGASELLLEAAENGDLDKVLQACHSGADVNVVDGRGMMPIHWAALRGHIEVIIALLDNGANVDSKNTAGWTPVMHASLEGHRDSVKILLERGADVNSRTVVSGTALMFASGKGHKEIVNILLDAGADPFIQIEGTESDDGMTALSYALQGGYLSIVEILRQSTKGSL